MRTCTVTFFVSEAGDVKKMSVIDEDNYQLFEPLSVYDAPYLGSYDTSEDWRLALGAYAIQSCVEILSTQGCHGDSLAYVNESCSLYVYTIDFDS
jgi:hypothetical protein